MKKMLFILALVFTATNATIHAQYTGSTTVQQGTLIVSLQEGENSFEVPNVGKFTLTKKGSRFLNSTYKDLLGRQVDLKPIPANTAGAPKPECDTPLPDACFGTADKSIGLCICKPANLSTGGNPEYRVAARVTGLKRL